MFNVLGSRVLMKVFGLNICRFFGCLLILVKWIGILNLWVSVNIMLFLVVLFSLVIIRLVMFIVVLNWCSCDSVFWLVVLLIIISILCGVVGLILLSMWWILFSLFISLDWVCRWLVVLVISIEVSWVLLVCSVLNVIEVVLVFCFCVIMVMLLCLF